MKTLISTSLIIIFCILQISCKKEDDITDKPILTGTVTDIDSNTYKTVEIGEQWWMAENLKVTRYRNGDSIGTTTPATMDISGESTPKYQWANDGIEASVGVYGRLYTWYAVKDNRSVCPVGWHVPSHAEWTELTDYLGGEEVAGGKLKEAGLTHWSDPNEGATNSSGFTALPGGNRFNTGGFYNVGLLGFWWSTTEYDATIAWSRVMYLNDASVGRYSDYKVFGFSVRCVKD
jgi:uncharacterized protein (TIGR02145 family)